MKVAKLDSQHIEYSKSTSIYSYPSKLKSISVARIRVNGRHPQEDDTQFIEQKCDVVFYIIQGSGKVIIGDKSYDLIADDTISIPKGVKYYIEGSLDYIASTSPAYSPDQNQLV